MFSILAKLVSGASSYLSYGLYAAIAALAVLGYVQHERNLALTAELASTKTQLSTATAVNQSDQTAIGQVQSALADCQKNWVSAQDQAHQAASLADQLSQAIAQRAHQSQVQLKSLQGKPSYAQFLSIDLNAQYPDLASSLRNSSAGR